MTLIPARGNSKGIPRKNLARVAGRPLIAYTIRASQDSAVSETWVSTEDPEIKSVAQSLGARVLDRPLELATDTTSTEAVMLHFAEQVPFDRLVLLQCTCPLTTAEDINRVVATLREYDSALTVSPLHQFVWANGRPNYDPTNRPRRQDAPKTMLETGGLFGTTRESLLSQRCRVAGRIAFVEVPRSRSIDIDTYDDLELVRLLMERS